MPTLMHIQTRLRCLSDYGCHTVQDEGKAVPVSKQHYMKTYLGAEVKIHACLTLELAEG
jgi:hypothetical protein